MTPKTNYANIRLQMDIILTASFVGMATIGIIGRCSALLIALL